METTSLRIFADYFCIKLVSDPDKDEHFPTWDEQEMKVMILNVQTAFSGNDYPVVIMGAYVCFKHLDSITKNGMEGNDSYKLFLWKVPALYLISVVKYAIAFG